jgi:putative MATE family efflux protein
MLDASREDIVEGSLARALVVLAAPLVAQQIVVAAGAIVDIFWVGRLSEAAVAAVGLVVPVYAIIGLPALVAHYGAQILTAQEVGAENEARARQVPVQAMLLGLLLGVVLIALTQVFATDLVSLLQPSAEVFPLAVTYLSTYVFAFIPFAVTDSLEGGFVGWGDSRTSLLLNATNIGVNAVLDPLLIFGMGPFPEWHIFGAAMASVGGATVSAVLAAAIAASGRRHYRLPSGGIQFDVSTAREIVAVGGPVGLQNGARQAARLLMVTIVSVVGHTAGLAAYNVGAQLATLAFVPAAGLGGAMTSVVGQNLGAKQPERANRATWLGVVIAVVGLTGLGIIQWIFPEIIARIFVPDISGHTLELTVAYLKILALGYWALGAIYTFEAGFNGASRTRISMYSTLLQYWTVRLPIAGVGAFVLGLGVYAVFWGVTLSNIAAALGLGAYFYYKTSDGMMEHAADAAAD